ncbi:MAG: flap endonuclease-1 [Candidatus Bathyarchaeia archaeon]
MGTNLRPIIVKKVVSLEELRGGSFAVDANNILYQFLSVIRTPDGTPLRDPQGGVTSHLAGLMYRSTRLIHNYGLKLVFVFDGKPHELKEGEIARRRKVRDEAMREWIRAKEAGDYATAFSKSVMTSRLTTPMVEDAKRLIKLMGIPHVQAPGEAEAQAAHMARKGDVWTSNSRDYDSLLFGTPRLVRYLTISGEEFLPSKGVARPLEPEVVELGGLLTKLGISHEQLIDLAILIGTDFNDGLRGVGAKTALRLLRRYGRLEGLPAQFRSRLPSQYQKIREIFLRPDVTDDYSLRYEGVDEEGLLRFLCDERGFSMKRVSVVIKRMRRFYSGLTQASLKDWI